MRKRPTPTYEAMQELWADLWARWSTRREYRKGLREAAPFGEKEERRLLRGMTNWQMTQWHRAGRPKDLIRRYAGLRRGEKV